MTVLTFWHFTLYSLLMALRICLLLERRSTKKVRMFSDYNVSMQIAFPYLNLLHSRLRDNGLLDDGVNVHLVVLGNGSSLILGLAGKLQSMRAEEVSVRVNLTNSLLLFTLNLLSSSSSYDDETIAKTESYPE